MRLRWNGRGGRSGRTKNPGGTRYGLEFPANAGSVSNANSIRFKWTGSALVPIYGTAGAGLTYLWRYYPKQQTGYYSTFFWGNDDGAGALSTFLWNGGGADSYYGGHPYPHDGVNPLGSSGTVHQWEISVEQNDYVNGAVVKDAWYKQAFRAQGAVSAAKLHEFYWNLPNLDSANRVFRTSGTTWGNQTPPSPSLTWGDAPWQPSHERGCGIHRGIIILNSYLSTDDIVTLSALETDADVLASVSSLGLTSALWYLNMNPTPDDISDKSGNGHNPAWWNANRPTLWVG